MLRVVLKLHHPQISIRAQHQLALRSTAHPANCLHHHNRQGPFPFLSRVAHPDARVSSSCFASAPCNGLRTHRLPDRHGHHQIVMRSGRRSGTPALIGDKGSALRQQPPAHEPLRRLAQQYSHAGHYLRLRCRRRQPTSLAMLFVHTPVTLAGLDVRQHRGAMIVPFDSDQRSSVFLRKVYRDASKILRAQPFTKLRTLQPCRNLHHLHRGKVTNVTSTRGVHRNYILASHNRLEPHLQRAVASPLHRLWRLSHTLIQRIDVKTTSSRRSEAGRSILGKLLRPKQPVGPIQTATEPDLRPSQAVLRDQSTLLRAHRLFCNCRPVVRRLHPPRKEVPHDIAVRVRL